MELRQYAIVALCDASDKEFDWTSRFAIVDVEKFRPILRGAAEIRSSLWRVPTPPPGLFILADPCVTVLFDYDCVVAFGGDGVLKFVTERYEYVQRSETWQEWNDLDDSGFPPDEFLDLLRENAEDVGELFVFSAPAVEDRAPYMELYEFWEPWLNIYPGEIYWYDSIGRRFCDVSMLLVEEVET